jgi:hypothetical protein
MVYEEPDAKIVCCAICDLPNELNIICIIEGLDSINGKSVEQLD